MWTVTSSIGTQSFDASPINIELFANDTALVELVLVFDNGCSSTIVKEIIVDELLPEAMYSVDVSSCQPIDGMFEVTFTNTTELTGVDIQSVSWEISSAGLDYQSNEDPFSLILPADSLVIVDLTVVFENGCQATIVDTIMSISSMNMPAIEYEIGMCDENGYSLLLSAISPLGVDEADIAEWTWTILNDGTIQEFTGADIELMLVNGIVEIELNMLLENGCDYSTTLILENGIGSLIDISADLVICDSLNSTLFLEASLDSMISGSTIESVVWTVSSELGEEVFSGNPVYANLDVQGTVTVTALVTLDNGCVIEVSTQDINYIGEYDVQIESNVNICLGNSFLVEFLANVISSPDGVDLSYNWDININGETTNSVLQTLILQLNEGDSLQLVLTVSDGEFCDAMDSISLTTEDLLPQYEIVKTLTDCGDPNVVNIELVNTGLGNDLEIESEEWEVLINGVLTTFDSSPFELNLNAQDSVEISVHLEYVNGCDDDFECDFAVVDILPEASFDYTIDDCESTDFYTVTFVNTTFLDGIGIQDIDWSITIDNSNQLFGTDTVVVTIPVGAYVLVDLQVLFENGCLASISQEFEHFVAIPDLNITASIIECTDEGISVDFFIPSDSISIDSIVWTVVNGTEVFESTSDTISVFINDELVTTVSAIVYLSNGCITEVSEEYIDGVLPDLILTGEAYSCDSDLFYVCYEAMVPDSIVNLDLVSYEWTVDLGGETLSFDSGTICFETTDLTGFNVVLLAQASNGCTLSGMSDEVTNLGDIELEIQYEIQNCDEENYNVILYNDLGMLTGFDSLTYEWIIDINGDQQIFVTDTIEIMLMSGDSLTAVSNVMLSEDCIVTDTLSILADGMLPSSEIVVNLLECLSPFTFEVEVFAIDSFPTSFVVDSISWTVDANGVITQYDTSPFTLQLNLNSEVSITYEVFFTNGCSLVVEELINPGDLLPEASFEIEGLNCDSDSSELELLIYNTTVFDTVAIEEIDWLIVIDGMTTGYEGDSIMITVPTGTIITVSHMVDFANGCTVTGIQSILVEKPTLEFTGDPIITCGETDVPLIANPNPDWEYSYIPEDGLVFINGDSTNPFVVVDTFMTYIVTVDNGICEVTDTVDVLPYMLDTLEILVLDTLCTNTPTLYVVDANDAYTYEWSNTPDFADVIAIGDSLTVTILDTVYYVQYFSEEDCVQGLGQVFVTSTLLDIEAPQPMMFCDGDTLTYTVVNNNPNQDIQVVWNDDPHILSELDSNEIVVTIFPGEESFDLIAQVTNQFGCDSLLMVTFEAGDSMQLGFTYEVDCSDLTVCFTLDSSFTGSVLWDFGDGSTDADTSSLQNPCYTYPNIGDYTVSLMSTELTCMPEPFIQEINVFDELFVEVGADTTTVLQGKDVTLFVINGEPGWTYEWSDGQVGETIIVTPEESDSYSVTVTDENGCQGVGIIDIDVIPFECNASGIYLPNAFSPNGDGVNDILYVRSNGVMSMTLVIYNRWGEKVFETQDISVGWDGMYKSKPLEPNAFGYYLRAVCMSGEVYEEQGNVSLIK
jgi:gliding motility-associated-like protein